MSENNGETDLRESETKLRAIFAQVSDLILLLEVPPDGMPLIQDVSASCFRLLGYPARSS